MGRNSLTRHRRRMKKGRGQFIRPSTSNRLSTILIIPRVEKAQLLDVTKKQELGIFTTDRRSTFTVAKAQVRVPTAVQTNQVRAILNIHLVVNSSQRSASQFSMPKSDRGLLTIRPSNLPSPFSYDNPNEVYKRTVAKHEGSFSIPKSDRNFNFSKFSSVHTVLV